MPARSPSRSSSVSIDSKLRSRSSRGSSKLSRRSAATPVRTCAIAARATVVHAAAICYLRAMRDRRSIAFVVPRYGREIVGGAETLARGFAERLPADRFAVEVLTTCALDHHTWKNVLAPGEERQGNVTVRRFP